MTMDPDSKLSTVELSSFKSMYPEVYTLHLKLKNSHLEYPGSGDIYF